MRNKNLASLLVDMVKERDIDIVCLAEDGTDSQRLKKSLSIATGKSFTTVLTRTPKLTVLTHDTSSNLQEVYGDASGRLSIRRLTFSNTEFLLAIGHFQSKLNRIPTEQNSAMQSFADEIRYIEAKRKNFRTILLGDFNMNPFEDGIVMSHGLHAVSTKQIAQKQTRTVDGKSLPFFYNPMWQFFGDQTGGPPGTIYYRGGRLSHEWSIFDQVLFRPDVLPWFDDDIEIVTTAGSVDLQLKSGRPNRRLASDHFPIVFSLKNVGTV